MEQRKFFLEKGKLEAEYGDAGLILTGQKVSRPGSHWLDAARCGWSPLYLNKKAFAVHLCDDMEKRFVYLIEPREVCTLVNHGAAILASSNPAGTDSEPDDLDEETKEWYRERISALRRKITAIDSRLSADLEHHEAVWDTKERVQNHSFYTSEQLWLQDKMSTEDYFHDETFRTARKKDIEFKAFEEKSNLEYQISQLENERRQAREEILKRKQERQNRQVRIQLEEMQSRPTYSCQQLVNFSEQAEIIFFGDELMAIYVPEHLPGVYELSVGDDWDFKQMKGKIFNVRENGSKKAESASLYHFLIDTYGERMTPVKVTAKKPGGLSNEEWNQWISLRQKV